MIKHLCIAVIGVTASVMSMLECPVAHADGPTATQLQGTFAAGSSTTTTIDSYARQLATQALAASSVGVPGGAASFNDSRLIGALQKAGGDASATLSTSTGTTIARSMALRGADIVNVADLGAIGDLTYQFAPFSMAVGSRTLSATAYRFTNDMVGKTIIVPGAGVSGAALVATIVSLADHEDVVLSAAASTALSVSGNITIAIGTDNTAAINAAIALALGHVNNNGSALFYSSGVYFPAGEYMTTAPINATGITADGFYVYGPGARLHSAAAGQVGVDALGSRFLRWRDVSIYGDRYASPKIGLQIGRTNSTPLNSSDNHDFEGFAVSGYFGLAAVLNENAETTEWNKVHFSNGTAGAYALIMDGVNHWAATSGFVTNNEPVESGQSFDENLFLNCIFGTSGTGGVPLWIADAHRLRIEGSYLANVGGVYAAVLYNAAGTSFDQPDFDLHVESTLTDVFLVTGPPGVTAVDMPGFRYWDNAPFASNSIFKIDPSSSITSVNMEDANIDIRQTTSPGQKLFDAPSAWKISGKVYVPDTFANNATNFSGVYCVALSCDVSGAVVTATGASSPQTEAAVALLANNALPTAGGAISGGLSVAGGFSAANGTVTAGDIGNGGIGIGSAASAGGTPHIDWSFGQGSAAASWDCRDINNALNSMQLVCGNTLLYSMSPNGFYFPLPLNEVAAASFSGGLTSSARTALGPEITLSSPTGAYQNSFFHENNGEFALGAGLSGGNALILDTTNTAAFPAVAFRQPDYQYPSTGMNANGSYEHGAVGYGEKLLLQGSYGYDYYEASRYDTTTNALLAPSRLVFQQTGGEPHGAVYYASLTTVSGSTSATLSIASPATAAGMAVWSEEKPGYLATPTTISAGQGTTAITLSSAATASGTIPVEYAALTYGQYSWMVAQEHGPVDFFPWASSENSETGVSNPYMRLDRANARVGIGAMGTRLPVRSLDVIGQAVFGSDTTIRSTVSLAAPINIEDPGTLGINWVKTGVNQFQMQWSSANLISFVDVNAGKTIFSYAMDGSQQSQQLARPVAANSGSVTAGSAFCGTLIRDTGTAAETYTIPSGLPVGCEFTVLQAGTDGTATDGLLSFVGGGGMNLEQKGTGTLHKTTGQFAEAVIQIDSSTTFLLKGDVQ